MKNYVTFIILLTFITCITESVDAQIIRKAGQFAASKVLSKSAKTSGKVIVSKAGSSLIKKTVPKVGGIATKYADEGVRAIGKLSSQSSRRLEMLSGPIQKSGQGNKLMKLIAERGDGDAICAFLYRNKATIFAGGTFATFCLNPDPFLSAAENVTSSAVHVAGESVVEPVVQHVVQPIAKWLGALVFVFGLIGGVYFAYTMKASR